MATFYALVAIVAIGFAEKVGGITPLTTLIHYISWITWFVSLFY